ncbi:hypothetical protein AB2L28_15925 [Kineococcus sp. TBRC 1896]|uniref:Uncharacterized protein n=1 Tax=Kineococcus mangrovi TaxID=1660183 RepID=A0ABV4I4V9_9ACTN
MRRPGPRVPLRPALRSQRGENGTVGLAGWVFADALLALTIIGLAAGGAVHAGVEAPAAAAAVATAAPTATPAPTVTVTAPAPEPVPSMPAGVAQAPVVLEVLVDGSNDDEVRASVAAAVGDLAAQGRRAAFVLTFGTAGDPAAGTALARRVNAQLDAAAPEVFAGSAKRDFWRAVNAQSPRAGVVQLELYLIQS